MDSIVLNLPYSSCFIPPAVRRGLGFSNDELRLEHWNLCDPHLANIFEEISRDSSTSLLKYPYSPLVADPLGSWFWELDGSSSEAFILPQGSSGKIIDWEEKDKDILIRRAVDPYYKALEEECKKKLKISPFVLLVTLRSFSSQPLSFEKNIKALRPQIMLGVQNSSTPKTLVSTALGAFQAFLWWVEYNRLHQPAAWLPPSLRGLKRVKALGLALRRDLYMDENTGALKESAIEVKRVLATVLNLLNQEMKRIEQLSLAKIEKRKIPSPLIRADKLK